MVRLELEPREYVLRNVWITTSGMCDHGALTYCLAEVGADRALFAVDYPYEDCGVAADFLAAADLDDGQRAAISHRNAERLFRLPGSVVTRSARGCSGPGRTACPSVPSGRGPAAVRAAGGPGG